MPRLRILAGPSPAEAVPISANDGVAHDIKSPHFEGHVCVFIRYEDELAAPKNSRPVSRASRMSASSTSSTESVAPDAATQYFGSPERCNTTWSIQVEGRFLQPVSSDDVLFGNTFERPLKLPWGSGAALKFMNFIDPTLEHDLGGPKPWALSPLVSTMPYLAHTKLSPNASLPGFPPVTPLTDSCGSLIPESHRTRSRSPSPSSSTANVSSRLFGSRPSSRDSSPSPSSSINPIAPASSKRRAIFGSQAARKATTLGPEDVLLSDFAYGFISFPNLTLKLPGGISFDCMKYWDNQPVTFMCCRRGADGKGPGDPFWCVMFEVLEDEQDEEAEEEDTSAGVLYGAGAVDEVD